MKEVEQVTKYHKFVSFGIALGFLIVVQKFATPEPIFRFLVPAFLILAGGASYYNSWYLNKINKYNFWSVLRPLLVLVAAFGLFLIIPGETIRGVFLLSAVIFITLAEILIGLNAENILLIETLMAAFGQFFTLAAFYEYAPAYGVYYVFGVFIATFFLTRVFYESVPQSAKIKMVTALIIGLFSAEVFWALNFLPLHFSPLAFLLFVIFYFCLISNYYYFFRVLTLKKIQFHLFLIIFCSAAVLICTPWFVI